MPSPFVKFFALCVLADFAVPTSATLSFAFSVTARRGGSLLEALHACSVSSRPTVKFFRRYDGLPALQLFPCLSDRLLSFARSFRFSAFMLFHRRGVAFRRLRFRPHAVMIFTGLRSSCQRHFADISLGAY